MPRLFLLILSLSFSACMMTVAGSRMPDDSATLGLMGNAKKVIDPTSYLFLSNESSEIRKRKILTFINKKRRHLTLRRFEHLEKNLTYQPQQLASDIVDASECFGLDAYVVTALIYFESAFDNWARSPSGANGLMQLMDAPRSGIEEVTHQFGRKGPAHYNAKIKSFFDQAVECTQKKWGDNTDYVYPWIKKPLKQIGLYLTENYRANLIWGHVCFKIQLAWNGVGAGTAAQVYKNMARKYHGPGHTYYLKIVRQAQEIKAERPSSFVFSKEDVPDYKEGYEHKDEIEALPVPESDIYDRVSEYESVCSESYCNDLHVVADRMVNVYDGIPCEGQGPECDPTNPINFSDNLCYTIDSENDFIPLTLKPGQELYVVKQEKHGWLEVRLAKPTLEWQQSDCEVKLIQPNNILPIGNVSY